MGLVSSAFSGFIGDSVQCWGCDLFDRLFQFVSIAAARAYDVIAGVCMVLFVVLFAFFVLSAVWKNIKGGAQDTWYTKSVQKVVINSLVGLSLLGFGVALPRFITTITFEPVAQVALSYTEAMIQSSSDSVNERVYYQAQNMPNNGFYRPQLRDTILAMMKTTVSQFQAYIGLGVKIIDRSFDWSDLLHDGEHFFGIANILKQIVVFFIGIALTWQFFKLFVRFCCRFVDIILAMTFFAFFFPISLVLTVFKDADGVPSWISSLGKSLGIEQFKSLINSIISLVATLVTYTVIMILIMRFFSDGDTSVADLVAAISNGTIYQEELSMDSIYAMTMGSCLILLFIINWIYEQIPQVTQMILSAFNVKEEKGLSEELANGVEGVGKNVGKTVANIGKAIGSALKKGGAE